MMISYDTKIVTRALRDVNAVLRVAPIYSRIDDILWEPIDDMILDGFLSTVYPQLFNEITQQRLKALNETR